MWQMQRIMGDTDTVIFAGWCRTETQARQACAAGHNTRHIALYLRQVALRRDVGPASLRRRA